MMMQYTTQQVHETESSVQKDTKLLNLKPHKFTVVPTTPRDPSNWFCERV